MTDRHVLGAIGRKAQINKKLAIPDKETYIYISCIDNTTYLLSPEVGKQAAHRFMVLRLTIFIAIIRSAASAMKSANLGGKKIGWTGKN